ncbi:hypothetical protein LJK88_38680 [Paenibacillus sp. P26]|nr:hypothetical protein LJK88_38680 [Paenibacillus sp. P26]
MGNPSAESFLLDNTARMAVFWIAWLVPMLVFFSFAGFFHRYYLVMLAPAVGALTGAGTVKMWRDYRARAISGWSLPLAVLSTAAVEAVLVWRYPALRGIMTAIIGMFTVATLLVLTGLRLKSRLADSGWVRTAAVTSGLAALLVAPAYWAFTPTIYGNGGSNPYAGPELKNVSGMKRQSTDNGKLTEFLTSHYTAGTYLVATPSAQTSSPLILDTGLPVLTWGGFSGSDPAITATQLEQMAREGKIKYFLISDMTFGSFRGKSRGAGDRHYRLDQAALPSGSVRRMARRGFLRLFGHELHAEIGGALRISRTILRIGGKHYA